ncbi:MAG TPA: ribosome silencing factor [Thermaerobacter sp.]
MTSREKALAIARAAEAKKAEDIVILEIGEITLIADYFVICHGQNSIQVRAIVDGVEEALAELGHPPRHREGYDAARWVLLDFDDVVLHVFLGPEREYYGLERLWGDARKLELESMR